MFQIYGDYSPLDVLAVAQVSDPMARCIRYERDVATAGSHAVISYHGEEVTVFGSPYTHSLLWLNGPERLEESLLAHMGGMRDEGDCLPRYTPITTFLSSPFRRQAIAKLRDTALYGAYKASGLMPLYTVLSSMDLTVRPLHSGQTYFAHDAMSLMSEVCECLDKNKRLLVAGDKSQDHGVLTVTDNGAARVEVFVNAPGSDYCVRDIIAKRPGLFDGLGTITLPESTAENAALIAQIVESLPASARTSQEVIHQLVPPMAFDRHEAGSGVAQAHVNDMVGWRGSISVASQAFNQNSTSALLVRYAKAGVLPQKTIKRALLMQEEQENCAGGVLGAIGVLLAHALPPELRVQYIPDFSGMDARDVLAIYPVGGARADAAYVHLGGAYATLPDRHLLAQTTADRPLPCVLSIGGCAAQGEHVAATLQAIGAFQSIEDYTTAHLPERERKEYLRRAAGLPVLS